MHARAARVLSVLLFCVTLNVARSEVIGKVTQPLVAGTEVSAQKQQELALISVRSKEAGCSGLLLNSEWVISAAHCFQKPNVKAYEVTIIARWPTRQERTGRELYLLEKDIAILRVDRPFEGLAADYNLPVYAGNLAAGRALYIYGRGVSVLASGSGNTAMPSQSDGKYRTAEFQITRVDGNAIYFGAGRSGAMPAGGDSGGPAFINAGGKLFLAGIASFCLSESVPGKPSDAWDWVNKITECGYAPLSAVWPRIIQKIGTPDCRGYATRAVAAANLAKDNSCDPAKASGPRFSQNFDDHLNFCKGAKPSDASFEDGERNKISQDCRVAAVKGTENQIAEERRVTGKSPQQCRDSSRRCEARIKFSFPGNPQIIPGEVARQCQPILAQCLNNSATAAAEFAEEKRVTGKTAQQCQISSRQCEMRIKAWFRGNPQIIPFEIARQCQPLLAQCMANAATEGGRDIQAGARIATAVNGTDLYPDNSGKSTKVCSMSTGETGKLLSEKEDDPRWLNIQGMSGDCRGKTGWVWKGDKGEDVTFN